MRPIACAKCLTFFRPRRSGIGFVEGKPKHSGVRPGRAEPEKWLPYKLWMGDLWECQGGCGASVIIGMGHRPIAEDYQDGFMENIRASGIDLLQINDC